MRTFNKVMLYGNLASDPEVKPTKTGRPLTTFSVATNEGWTNKDGEKVSHTDFHRIVAFGKLAEITGRYLKKGRPVIVSGRLKNSSYKAQDGSKRFSTEVVLQDFNFMPSGKRKEEHEQEVAA